MELCPLATNGYRGKACNIQPASHKGHARVSKKAQLLAASACCSVDAPSCLLAVSKYLCCSSLGNHPNLLNSGGAQTPHEFAVAATVTCSTHEQAEQHASCADQSYLAQLSCQARRESQGSATLKGKMIMATESLHTVAIGVQGPKMLESRYTTHATQPYQPHLALFPPFEEAFRIGMVAAIQKTQLMPHMALTNSSG